MTNPQDTSAQEATGEAAVCAYCEGSELERIVGYGGDETVIPCSMCQTPHTETQDSAVEEARSFGHDDEIGRLFEEYDRLVRWEEHNSRLDAQEPIVERAVARGRIVAFIANTAAAAISREAERAGAQE